MDKIEGYLEVGLNDNDEIVVNHPDLKPDENGIGHIVFSPNQAYNLGNLLLKHSNQARINMGLKREKLMRERAEAIPVDRSSRVLTNGLPEEQMPNYREIDADGMQKSYVVLSPEERAKGFVRPVRDAYVHEKCGRVTTMARSIAETYARCPDYYSGTFCSTCRDHFPVGVDGEFTWTDDGSKVGT